MRRDSSASAPYWLVDEGPLAPGNTGYSLRSTLSDRLKSAVCKTAADSAPQFLPADGPVRAGRQGKPTVGGEGQPGNCPGVSGNRLEFDELAGSGPWFAGRCLDVPQANHVVRAGGQHALSIGGKCRTSDVPSGMLGKDDQFAAVKTEDGY